MFKPPVIKIKVILILGLLLNSLILFSQKKTLVKFEFPVGVVTEDAFRIYGQPLDFFLPTLYIPLHKHLDIGAGYTTQKINYYVSEAGNYYSGNIKFKLASFYAKINLSASQKRVNPFFSYVLSLSKGTYTSPTQTTNEVGFLLYEGLKYFTYETRMTPAEEDKLKKVLLKSQVSHGVQIGVDYKIVPFLNLFLKTSCFSVMGYNQNNKKEQAFSIYYKQNTETYSLSPQVFFMGGIILKIDAGKKSLIK